MKKISLIMLLSVISLSTFAQVFSLGVKAGYNTSLGFDQNWNFDGSSINVKNDIANGFNAGFFARIGRSFYVQPELVYNMSIYNQGQGINTTVLITKQVITSTIDVPLLVGYSIINTDFFKFRIMAGPKFSFNAGSTKLDSWENISSTVKGTRVGLDTGIGIDLWRLSLDVRYNLIGNLYSLEDGTSNSKITVKPNNSFVISLGFRLLGNNSKK